MDDAIAYFRNEFDAINVTLTSANKDTTHDAKAPWTVRMIHDDPAIGTAENDITETFPSFKEAQARFLELVRYEMAAMTSEIG